MGVEWEGERIESQHHNRTQKLERCYNMRHPIINRARFWGSHYQAKIQDIQQRTTSSTCMMLKSGSLAETPKSTSRSLQTRHAAAHYIVDMYDAQVRLIGRDAEVYKQDRQLVANDSIWEQLSSPFLQKKQAIVFQTAASDP